MDLPDVTTVLGDPTPINAESVDRLRRLAMPTGEMIPRKRRKSLYSRGDRLIVQSVENLLYGRELVFDHADKSGKIHADLDDTIRVTIAPDQVAKKNNAKEA